MGQQWALCSVTLLQLRVELYGFSPCGCNLALLMRIWEGYGCPAVFQIVIIVHQ